MAKRLGIKQLVPLGDGLVALTECGRMFHKKAPIDFDGEQDPGEDWYEVEPVMSRLAARRPNVVAYIGIWMGQPPVLDK